jgi:hypothetical protein
MTNLLSFEYLPNDVVLIEGVKYAGDLFRAMAFDPVGSVIRIAGRAEDGVVSIQRLDIGERLCAAEFLLQQAEIVIEILKGDAANQSASEVLAAIENHWQTYPEPIDE